MAFNGLSFQNPATLKTILTLVNSEEIRMIEKTIIQTRVDFHGKSSRSASTQTFTRHVSSKVGPFRPEKSTLRQYCIVLGLHKTLTR